MIKHNELIRGRYYEVKFTGHTYLVKSTDNAHVEVRWSINNRTGKKERESNLRGTVEGSTIREISFASFIRGECEVSISNNGDAKILLDKEW